MRSHLFKSARSSCETDDFKSNSHCALIKPAKFYGMTADYLPGLTETKDHPNANLGDMGLNDGVIALLKSGRIAAALPCGLAMPPGFVKLPADVQIYIESIAAAQIQNLNAWGRCGGAGSIEKYQQREHDKTAGVPQAVHVREGGCFSSQVHHDIDGLRRIYEKPTGIEATASRRMP